MIQIAEKKRCTGCNACANICPVNAIDMVRDKEGFLYPEISKNKCVKCDACERVCPMLAPNFPKRNIELQVYAGWSKREEVRLKSTTGGIFYEFADFFLGHGGYVCGAIWNKDWSVGHMVSDERKDLEILMGSKYVQSDKGLIFREIKKLLMEGNKVMVCSLPCEVNGLYSYLGGDMENLLVVDMLCRGVNSPTILQSFISYLEEKYGAEAVDIHFKYKMPYGWHRFTTRVEFENGKIYNKDRYTDPFMRLFLNENCSVRPSCYECKFKSVDGYGDVTIADFWGIENFHPELDENKGTSMIKINTKKGKDFFEEVKGNIVFHECRIEEANTRHNSCFSKSIPYSANREEFFKDFNSMPFYKVLHKYVPDESNAYGKLMKLVRKYIKKAKGMKGKIVAYDLWQYFKLRKIVQGNGFCIPLKYAKVYIEEGCSIICDGDLVIGKKENPKTKQETSLLMKKGSKIICKGNRSIQTGCDIRLWENAVLEMGSGYFNNGVQIVCQGHISIGDNVVVARDVVIRDSDAHMMDYPGYRMVKPVVIEDNVWIASRATIMKGVTVGKGSVVAAGAVVTRDVPPCSLVAGVPARVIKDNITWS